MSDEVENLVDRELREIRRLTLDNMQTLSDANRHLDAIEMCLDRLQKRLELRDA